MHLTAPASEPGPAVRRRAARDDQGGRRTAGSRRSRSSTSTSSSRAAASRACCRSRSTRATRQNRLFYVDYTDTNGDTRVVEYRSDGTPRDPVLGAAALLRRSSRSRTTTAASSPFGPDGLLYVGMGDGGSGGDPNNNGQNLRRQAGEDLEARRQPGRARAGARRATGCATRGGSRSTARTATCTSATSARARGRRSTTCRVRGSAGCANFGWAVYEGTLAVRRDPDARPAGAVPSARSRSTRHERRLLRHRRLRLPRQGRGPTSPAATSTATTARGRSGA